MSRLILSGAAQQHAAVPSSSSKKWRPPTYWPFVLPAVGFATGVGPIIGIVIGVFAMVCDTFTIRRFFAVDHRWRWHFTAIAGSVIVLLSVLLVQDIMHLLR